MSTTHHDVVEAIAAAAEAVVDGLGQSTKILDPRTAPATKLHKVFSLDVQTRNTDRYRDRSDRRMRLEATAMLRVAWLLNPKDEASTQRHALRDEDNAVRAVLTSLRPPLNECRVLYRSTRRQVGTSREWLFADVTFSVEFDRSLTEDVA